MSGGARDYKDRSLMRDLENLDKKLFFVTERDEEGNPIEGRKVPQWFLDYKNKFFEMLHDLDCDLSGDTALEEGYFEKKKEEILVSLLHSCKPELQKT